MRGDRVCDAGMPDDGFLEIAFDSAGYREECALRDEVLRRPLGMSLWDEDLSSEALQYHFGWFANGCLLACLIAVPLTETEVKVRQMAVSPEAQGRGIGRLLLTAMEREWAARGYREAVLHARAGALGFYQKLGYQCEGPGFTEVGIPHRRMRNGLLKSMRA